MLKLLQEQWAKDTIIDSANIDDEIVKIPKLHQKYLDILTHLKIHVFKKQAEFLKLKGARTRYYSGTMGREDLADYGWEQYQGKQPLKSELERLLEVDPILLASEEKLFELKASFEYCESVMNSLKWRGSELKTIMEWKRFIAGG
jgi:hypothetical protein